MVGQKQRIIRRLEKEAKKKFKKMKEAGISITCACSKPKWHLVSFNIDEIKEIIMNFNILKLGWDLITPHPTHIYDYGK